jgi:small subunit ribosomal protein S15
LTAHLAHSVKVCYLFDMLTKRKKQNVIAVAQRHATDTGSPEVQIAVLTKRIAELAAHLDKNDKDKHGRRGLLRMVADRRTHMRYLEKKNKRALGTITKKLGLKK